jgi:hypothetical protein
VEEWAEEWVELVPAARGLGGVACWETEPARVRFVLARGGTPALAARTCRWAGAVVGAVAGGPAALASDCDMSGRDPAVAGREGGTAGAFSNAAGAAAAWTLGAVSPPGVATWVRGGAALCSEAGGCA